jgi:fermentation-respiration switch protein FrsA (DUF1100 family)
MIKKTLLRTLAGRVAVLMLFTVLLPGCENLIIYHPDKYPKGLWDTSQMPLPIQDVWFTAEDGVKLHGWYVPAEDAVATLLFFHGNAGNITHRLENIFFLHHLKINVFIFDYRGFGRSEGDPEEEDIYLDSQAAYDTVLTQPGVSQPSLFIFGRSLGGAFASYTASKNPAAGLILESTFTNAVDWADRKMSIIPKWYISSELNTQGYVADLKIPKLFIHGTRDNIIPFTLGRELYKGAAQPKEFYSIIGAGHNNTWRVGGKEYFDTFKEFVVRVQTGQATAEQGTAKQNESSKVSP